MKNLLFSIGLLLTMDSYSNFDTIRTISTIASIQVVPEGTLVSNNSIINLDSGIYVLHFTDLPKPVSTENIEIEALDGMEILSIEVSKVNPKLRSNPSYSLLQQLKDEIDSTSKYIRTLNEEEKDLIVLKRMNQEKKSGIDQLISFQDYYRQKDRAIRKERNEAYQQLIVLREKINAYHQDIELFKNNFAPKNSELFIALSINQKLEEELKWSYLIPNNSKPIEPILAFDNEIPPSIELKGRVIEGLYGAPIVFATIEFYQNRKLISSTTSDYNGEFKAPLATNQNYKMVVSFNGYKKKKFKNLNLNTPYYPVQIIQMHVKNKVSAIEIMAYTLPLLDIIRIVAD